MCMKCDFKKLNLSTPEDQRKAEAMISILMNAIDSADDILQKVVESSDIEMSEVIRTYHACGIILSSKEQANELREKAVEIGCKMIEENRKGETHVSARNQNLH